MFKSGPHLLFYFFPSCLALFLYLCLVSNITMGTKCVSEVGYTSLMACRTGRLSMSTMAMFML